MYLLVILMLISHYSGEMLNSVYFRQIQRYLKHVIEILLEKLLRRFQCICKILLTWNSPQKHLWVNNLEAATI